jgi:GNAT superfamily N-acetyltransferase
VSAVRRAEGDAEVAAAADLIARSFDHLGANRYLVGSDAERLPVLTEFFHLQAAHAADGNGEVLLIEDGAGVAVWFDRTRDIGEPPDFEQRLKSLAGPHLDRFAALGELLDGHHPTERHWHLAFLAVHPDRWGGGLGSALMRHTHRRLDAEGLPAYLEATNADNRRVYRRHGYADLEPCAVHLPDGTPFYRMWRPPATA